MSDSGGEGMSSEDEAGTLPNSDSQMKTSVAASTSAAASTPMAGTSMEDQPAAVPRPYIRQFHNGYTGILEVWIRSTDGMKLPNITIQSCLNKKFKSIASIIPDRDKLAVVFGDRDEANSLIRGPFYDGIVVNIPSKRVVDVEGAVRADDLDGIESLDALKNVGQGLCRPVES